jgi:hypothetical protein
MTEQEKPPITNHPEPGFEDLEKADEYFDTSPVFEGEGLKDQIKPEHLEYFEPVYKDLEEYYDYLDTLGNQGVVVVFNKSFEAKVGVVGRLSKKEKDFMLTEHRIRAYVMLVSPKGEIVSMPFHQNFAQFDGFLALHKTNSKLSEVLLEISSSFSGIEAPYEKSSFSPVILKEDEVKKSKKARELRNLIETLDYYEREKVELEYQNTIRDKIAKLTAEIFAHDIDFGKAKNDEFEF